MKSYLQGIITGGVCVFAILLFIGASRDDVGRYQIVDIEYDHANFIGGYKSNTQKSVLKIDTKTGENWQFFGETTKDAVRSIGWYKFPE